MSENNSVINSVCSIEDLPDEVLEYILSLLPPYIDLDNCMNVNLRWKKIVENVFYHCHQLLLKSLANFDVQWENITPSEKDQSITKRYSHSACCHDNFMYVFGGCTRTMTTFNDLWKLDLSTRQWSRLLTMGTYPSPKACATLVHHDSCLLLFGGKSHPSTYYFSYVWSCFDELHIYNIYDNRWTSITSPTNQPPPMAGHSASVHKNYMLVFGGMHGQNVSSNDVWCFDILTHQWRELNIQGIKPKSRYGQTQVVLDDEHFLIIGGCGGGPNEVWSDVWMLVMEACDPNDWHWKQVTVCNPQWAPSHLWCHPACRVGDYVVAFSRNPVSTGPMLQYSKLSPNRQLRPSQGQTTNASHLELRLSDNVVVPAVDRDVNVNGRRGSLSRSQPQPMDVDAAASSKASPRRAASVLQPLPIANSRANQANTPVTTTITTPQCSSLNQHRPSVLCDRSNRSSPSCRTNTSGPSLSQNSSGSRSNMGPSSSTNSGSSQDSGISGTSIRPTNSSNHSSSQDSGSSRSNIRSMNSSNSGISHDSGSGTSRHRPSSDHRSLNSLYNANSTIMAAFRVNDIPLDHNRTIRLAALSRVQERLNAKAAAIAAAAVEEPSTPPLTTQPSVPKMAMFVLDITRALSADCQVTWLPIKAVADGCPGDTIFYSLVAGNGELIMFGGLQEESSLCQPHNFVEAVSNALHFITAPRTVI
ncbi:F-box only protein 42 isoform X3 [Nilaparvata lugens]|uniref:F-box only protein 42 isoform X1 n=1 Tax=Nilaparvata lugens TaxID=108931 RepID=UPI00193E4216|nr:F-box only protein 42 isoform X1 [Nilaparvata lugens]XP_039280009.1 F-box only protein 42 isoform X2 [Nilaparvata lugens]XP_039280010.1 F-box only protein 42 isoform X3 [Nilaparvata lugens]